MPLHPRGIIHFSILSQGSTILGAVFAGLSGTASATVVFFTMILCRFFTVNWPMVIVGLWACGCLSTTPLNLPDALFLLILFVALMQ